MTERADPLERGDESGRHLPLNVRRLYGLVPDSIDTSNVPQVSATDSSLRGASRLSAANRSSKYQIFPIDDPEA